MPIRDLQFDLRPRRARRAWRLVAAAAAGLALGGLAWQATLRQAEQEERERQAAAEAARSAQRPAPRAAWEAAAEEDGRLFDLTVDARLLEMERCTDDRMTVERFVHSAPDDTTSMELRVPDGRAIDELLQCLHADGSERPAWRLVSVEAAGASSTGPADPANYRVVVRRP